MKHAYIGVNPSTIHYNVLHIDKIQYGLRKINRCSYAIEIYTAVYVTFGTFGTLSTHHCTALYIIEL